MKKLSVCVLFGGVSPEHEVSLRSAESVLNNLDKEKYNIFPVGITKTGEWILYGGRDYSKLPTGEWQHCPENRRAAISPVRGQGLLNFEGDCVVRERIDVVFPVLHGENGEDGSVQGLLQLAGLPYVGPGVAASATCMDKTLTKLVADRAGIRQAAWRLVTARELANNPEAVLDGVEKAFSYPVFIKPAGTGSSVGVSKAKNREALLAALTNASKYDSKILVEEFINGSAMPVRPPPSAARSTLARNSMTTTPNISLTAPSSISRRASRRRYQSACATTPSASMRPWAAAACPAWTSS